MSAVKEFKEFISKGNVVDLAVGVIIGAAFGKIIASLVSNIIMPIIGLVIQGVNFEGLSVKVGQAEIKYGLFIGTAIDFLIISVVIFSIVKAINIMKKKEEKKAAEPTASEKLLIEIRDLLKDKNL